MDIPPFHDDGLGCPVLSRLIGPHEVILPCHILGEDEPAGDGAMVRCDDIEIHDADTHPVPDIREGGILQGVRWPLHENGVHGEKDDHHEEDEDPGDGYVLHEVRDPVGWIPSPSTCWMSHKAHSPSRRTWSLRCCNGFPPI